MFDTNRVLGNRRPQRGSEIMEIHIGTSGYGYREWKGSFYPEKISSREMLRFYAERFDTVEINYTFYHMPTRKTLTSWEEQVPDGFTFALKASQAITHHKRLRDVEEETRYFFRTLTFLGRKTGPVLFQFPRSFHLDRLVLEDFLELIPPEFPCAFEFRNPSWLIPEVYGLLRAKKHSLCTADTDEKPAVEIISTADWGYLRLRRSRYSDADLARWLERIRALQWEKAYVFFKHGDESHGAETALRLAGLLEGEGG